jgi:hypothetical protein
LLEGWNSHYNRAKEPCPTIGVVCGFCAVRIKRAQGRTLYFGIGPDDLYSFSLEDDDPFNNTLSQLIAEENCPQCGEKH